MNITKEQSMAYTEVLEVLKYMPKQEVNKIPKDIMDYYYSNKDSEYFYKIDKTKSFKEQELSEKAKVVLAILFRDYWATDEQKEKIKRKEQNDLKLAELEKKQKYNNDSLFIKKEENDIKENNQLVEYKEKTIFIKIIDYIKNILGKNK